MFVESGKIINILGNEQPLISTREKFKLVQQKMNGKANHSRLEKNQTSLGRHIITNIVTRVSYVNYETKDLIAGKFNGFRSSKAITWVTLNPLSSKKK